MRRKRFLALGLVAVLLAVIVAGLLIGTSTSYSEIPLAYVGRPGDPVPPAWSRPCQRRNRRYGSRYVLPCGHVEGVVLYRESQDPDGDDDVHAVVQAGFRVVIVKSREGRGAIRLPGTGSRVDVAGERYDGRFGLAQIDVRRLYGRR